MTSLLTWIAATGTAAVVTFAGTRFAGAQSLERRVIGGADGGVEFTFAARAGVCGDGATFVEDGLGGESRIYEGGNFSGRTHRFDDAACLPGPVRVVAWVADGEVIRVRTYAGPSPSTNTAPRRELGDVSVSEAVAFLTRLAERGNGRASEQALLPLVLADSVSAWPTLVRFARDEQIGRPVRRTAAFWLSRGASAKLGILDSDRDDEDDVRASAVFALSQQPRSQSTPQLLEIARTSKRPAVRAQALFWLGQSGDSRAIDLFAEILGVR
jgi:hypothetical protein